MAGTNEFVLKKYRDLDPFDPSLTPRDPRKFTKTQFFDLKTGFLGRKSGQIRADPGLVGAVGFVLKKYRDLDPVDSSQTPRDPQKFKKRIFWT